MGNSASDGMSLLDQDVTHMVICWVISQVDNFVYVDQFWARAGWDMVDGVCCGGD